jgi:hypothetical protein
MELMQTLVRQITKPYQVNYTGGDPASESGTIDLLDAPGGNIVGSFNFSQIENIICFATGTSISTAKGERLVEQLNVGDRVITRDNGIQKVAWIGQRTLTRADLMKTPEFAPVVIKAGSLGDGYPERDLVVSPNHRLLSASPELELIVNDREALVATKHMVGKNGIVTMVPNEVTYVHVMFENHEVILSNGLWTESFQPGDYSVAGIESGQRQELLRIFPELQTDAGMQDYGSARTSLKKHEAMLMMKMGGKFY